MTSETNVKTQVEETRKKLDLANKTYTVELDTSKGPIRLKFFPDVAKGHVENFLALSQIGFYDNLTFHRVIAGFMIQGGCPLGTGTGDGGYKIPQEFNKTPHVAGVSVDGPANDPNSAGTQFFICLGTQKGISTTSTPLSVKVADEESLDTVKAIGAVRTSGTNRWKKSSSRR